MAAMRPAEKQVPNAFGAAGSGTSTCLLSRVLWLTMKFSDLSQDVDLCVRPTGQGSFSAT